MTPQDVGARVSVRRRLGQEAGPESYGDVVGLLEAWEGGLLRVRRRDGALVEVDEGAVVAGRVVPPTRTYRRRSPAAAAPAEEVERVAADGWRAPETAALGDWRLRAADGFTGRANSALAVGDPGTSLDDALARVRSWYAARGLRPLVQVVAGSDLDGALAEAGWRVPESWPHGADVEVRTAMLGDVRDRLPARPEVEVRLDEAPDEAWLRCWRGDEPLSATAREVLAGHPRVAFASVGGDPREAVARVAVDPPWAGIFAVEVAPHARRRGHARALVTAVLDHAAGQGADRVYLQVSAANAPGVALWERLGLTRHHGYLYRAAPPRSPAAP